MYQDGTCNGRLEEVLVKSPIRLTCELAVRKREKLGHKAYLSFYIYVLFTRMVDVIWKECQECRMGSGVNLHFGHVTFEIPVRHPRGNVEKGIGYLSLVSERSCLELANSHDQVKILNRY